MVRDFNLVIDEMFNFSFLGSENFLYSLERNVDKLSASLQPGVAFPVPMTRRSFITAAITLP